MVTQQELPGIRSTTQDAMDAGGFPFDGLPMTFNVAGDDLVVQPNFTESALSFMKETPNAAIQDAGESVEAFVGAYLSTIHDAMIDSFAGRVDMAAVRDSLGLDAEPAGGADPSPTPSAAEAQAKGDMPPGTQARFGVSIPVDYGVSFEHIHTGESFGANECREGVPIMVWRTLDEDEFEILNEQQSVMANEAGQGMTSSWVAGPQDAISRLFEGGEGYADDMGSDKPQRSGWLVGMKACLTGSAEDGTLESRAWKGEFPEFEYKSGYSGDQIVIYEVSQESFSEPEWPTVKKVLQIDYDPLELYTGVPSTPTGVVEDAMDVTTIHDILEDDDETGFDAAPSESAQDAREEGGVGGQGETSSDPQPSPPERPRTREDPSEQTAPSGEPTTPPDMFGEDFDVAEFETSFRDTFSDHFGDALGDMAEEVDEGIDNALRSGLEAGSKAADNGDDDNGDDPAVGEITDAAVRNAAEQYDLENWNAFFGSCRQDGFDAAECGQMWSELKDRGLAGKSQSAAADNGGGDNSDSGSSGGASSPPSPMGEDAQEESSTSGSQEINGNGGGGGGETIHTADSLSEADIQPGQAVLLTQEECPGCELIKNQPEIEQGLETGALIEIKQGHPLWEDIMLDVGTAMTPTVAYYDPDEGFVEEDRAGALGLI